MSERSPVLTPSRAPITEEHRAEAIRRVNSQRFAWVGFWWEWSKSFLVALVLFLFIRAFFVEAYKIPSGSMERTLLVGDFLLVNKLVYGANVPFTQYRLPAIRTPRRGDVMVFIWPKDPTKTLVKRVVGVPGDTLEMREATLVRNGVPLRERYVWHGDPGGDPGENEFSWQNGYLVRSANAVTGYHPSRNNWGPLIVPEQSYFVLGDNRDNSYDSRYWGFVPDSMVRGEPMFVYYSFGPDSLAKAPWLTSIRWKRLGSWID